MEPLLTRQQAAKLLGISVRHLDSEKAAGRIAWVALGRSVRFRPEAVEAYAKHNERVGVAAQSALPQIARAAPLNGGFDLAALERAIPARRASRQV